MAQSFKISKSQILGMLANLPNVAHACFNTRGRDRNNDGFHVCGHIQLNMNPVKYTTKIIKLGQNMFETFAMIMMGADISQEIAQMCCTCFIILLSKCMNKPDQYAFMVNYNILCHQHMTTNLHRFYWNSTKLWFRKSDSKCFKLSDHIREMKIEGYPQFQEIQESDFRALHVMPLINTIVNIKWLKPHHWKHMVLEKNLLDQTRMIAKKWVFAKDEHGIGPVTNYAVFLMEFIASNLSTRKYGCKYVKYCKNKLTDISIILQLKLEGFGKEFKKNVNKIENERWSEWYSKEECTRMECKNKRGTKENRCKFRMCKKCKIASYCSRRCAKLDWNEGYHKVYCNKYVKHILDLRLACIY